MQTFNIIFTHLKNCMGEKEPIVSDVSEHKHAVITASLDVRFYQLM